MSSPTPDPALVEATVALERAVPMLVRWFTRSEVRRSMLAHTDPALSATDAWLLGRITDTGPVRLSHLADWQEVDRSTMTIQIRRLEKLGLVSRKTDPDDRRAVRIQATRTGAAVHRRTKETARGVYEQLLQEWPEADLHKAVQVAARLIDTLERRPTGRVGMPHGSASKER